ncbi:MAG TPA: alpha/beta fold hydrolase [Pseudonocardia sp.]|nr:alpha/beta fold hydrolase [Pseudonocardia sp.]
MRSTHHPSGDPRTVVLLPGSGSDEVFVRAALAAPLRAVGLTVHTPTVRPGAGVVAGYLDALEQAAALGGPVLVGGISLGAQVAARWAARRTDGAVAGLLLALPAWTGLPGSAPAAVAAAITADAVRRDGLTATIDNTRAQTPGWLGDELARAWRRHGDGLADSLETAAATPGPTEAELAGLRVPVAVVGLRDDPVHPLSVARQWAELVPRSALVSSTLAALGRDRCTLGRAIALAWLRASSVALTVP